MEFIETWFNNATLEDIWFVILLIVLVIDKRSRLTASIVCIIKLWLVGKSAILSTISAIGLIGLLVFSYFITETDWSSKYKYRYKYKRWYKNHEENPPKPENEKLL